MAQYPHVRVFYGSDGLVHFMPFTNAAHNGQYAEKHIGQGLIDFAERYLENLKRAPQSAASLTERELEVLALTAEGLKRDEIAARLNVSAGTVKTHLQNIYQKLEANGKAAAVKKAQNLKIL